MTFIYIRGKKYPLKSHSNLINLSFLDKNINKRWIKSHIKFLTTQRNQSKITLVIYSYLQDLKMAFNEGKPVIQLTKVFRYFVRKLSLFFIFFKHLYIFKGIRSADFLCHISYVHILTKSIQYSVKRKNSILANLLTSKQGNKS